jgi:hypothetical protein
MEKGIGFALSSSYMAARNKILQQDVVVIYVEGHDDIRLWKNIVKSKLIKNKSIRLSFKPPSLDGEANGKSTLIQMYNNNELIVGKNLLICLDSDLDYIIGLHDTSNKNEIYKDEFVFQTYTYSSENHYYTLNGLNELCETATCSELDIDFCLEEFMTNWSISVYEVYCKTIYLKKISEHDLFKQYTEEFRLLLSKHFSGNINLSKIDILERKFNNEVILLKNKINTLNFYDSKYEDFLSEMKGKGLTEKNIHLFYKGHYLEDHILSPLCTSVSKRIISNVRSDIFKHNRDPKVRLDLMGQYNHNCFKVINTIKARTSYEDNVFFEQIKNEFVTMFNQYH